MRRIWTGETATIDVEMDAQAPELNKKYGRMDEGLRLAAALARLSDNGKTLEFTSRDENGLRGAFDKAVGNVDLLRTRKPKRNNDPEPAATHQVQNEPDELLKTTERALYGSTASTQASIRCWAAAFPKPASIFT
jgi:hypothetical protein